MKKKTTGKANITRTFKVTLTGEINEYIERDFSHIFIEKDE